MVRLSDQPSSPAMSLDDLADDGEPDSGALEFIRVMKAAERGKEVI